MKTIKINCSSERSFACDYLYINLNINHKFNTYEECVNDSKNATNRIYEMIEKASFNKDELVLTSYNVYPNNESYMEDDVYKTRQNGFSYDQSYKMGMSLDFVKLSKLLEILESNEDFVTFSVSFGLKNEEKYKDKVLKIAIKDCYKKAGLIAKETNHELCDIVNIEYNHSSSNGDRPLALACRANSVPSFKPEDIRVRQNIVVTFEIK